MKLLSLALAFAATTNAIEQIPIEEKNAKPNIIVILTDDQDLHMDSLDYMPLLKKHITDHGTFYKRHYCSTAICCPSRVTLWTGRNAHNTNVTDVFPPYGGYPKFVSQGFNDAYLPIWLQEAGYSTYYTGKLFNHHSVDNWNSPHPAGWTSSDFLLDPHTYEYLNATFQRNDQPPVSLEGEYSTDIIAGKAFGLLEEGIQSKKPFFLTIAPIAPHANARFAGNLEAKKIRMTAPVPAEKYKHLFPDAKVPRRENFNPDQPSGVSWIKHLDQLSPSVIKYNDDFYRARLQALQSVDELISNLFSLLSSHNLLPNTYILYTTDNGYHISQHRLPPGKECGFEEDINVPLIIRGPGVPEGKESDVVTAHTDLAPTILKIAKGKWEREDFDGSPIPLDGKALGREVEEGKRQEHVNVEYWGSGLPEGVHGFSLDDGKEVFYVSNNTYKALRLIGEGYNLYYSVWCTNEHELYDLTTDPHQTYNLYPSPSSNRTPSINIPMSPSSHTHKQTIPLSQLLARLDALLMVTKSCIGYTCIHPWSAIHPKGDVKTLKDALRDEFNGFYAHQQEKVRFDRCELGYILESEGPQAGGIFGVKHVELNGREEGGKGWWNVLGRVWTGGWAGEL